MTIDFPKAAGDELSYEEVNLLLRYTGLSAAQNAYQTLQATDVFDNKNYLGADEFVDVNGTNNTVNTTNTTAAYSSTLDSYSLNFVPTQGDTTHDPNSFTDPEKAFNDDDNDYAHTYLYPANSSDLGKTFSNKFISKVKIKAKVESPGGYSKRLYLQTYDGSNWDAGTIIATSSSTSVEYDGVYELNQTVQGIRIHFFSSQDNFDSYLYTLKYDFESSSSVETNEILVLDETLINLVVYADKTIPTNTSILIDVSDNGGATWNITNKAIDASIDLSSLTGTSLALKFKLATTDATKTPSLKGYGVSLI